MIASDHVAVEHGDNAAQRHDGMRDMIARTQQSSLLGTMKHNENGPLGWLLHERTRRRKDGYAHRAVVIGSGPY